MWTIAQHFAQTIVRRNPKFIYQIDDAVAFFPAHGPEEAFCQVLRRSIRVAVKHRQEFGRGALLSQCIFDELGEPSFNANARTQFLFQRRPAICQVIHGLAGLSNGTILFALRCFRAEPDKRRAHQRFHLGIGFFCQRIAKLLRGFAEHVSTEGGQQVRQLCQTGRRFSAVLGFCGVQLAGIVLQHNGGCFSVFAFEQQLNILPHVASRNAGCIFGKQRLLLAVLGKFRPEHAIEHVGMRLHQHSRLAHPLFVSREEFAQVAHLLTHLFQQLVDRIYFQIAGLKPLQGVPDRHLLGSTH